MGTNSVGKIFFNEGKILAYLFKEKNLNKFSLKHFLNKKNKFFTYKKSTFFKEKNIFFQIKKFKQILYILPVSAGTDFFDVCTKYNLFFTSSGNALNIDTGVCIGGTPAYSHY